MPIIIAMFIFFAIGVPIAYTLGATGLVAIFLAEGTRKLAVVPLMIFSGSEHYALIAIPLFILMGQIMTQSGIADKIIEFAGALVGWIRGGLGMATVAAGMAMAAISGSSVADAAALGSIMIPQMDGRGYGKPFAVAIVCASATLAQLIPPSLSLIIFGVIAGVSIGELFIAGIVPGIIMGLLLMMVIYWRASKMKLPTMGAFTFIRLRKTFIKAILSLLLPIIVIGGIMGGVFTPTEAGAVGVGYATFIAVIIYRRLKFKEGINALAITAKRTAIVMLMVGASALLGWYVTDQGIAQKIANAILSFSNSKYVVLMLINGMLIITGMFLHGTPMIILLVPITAPLVQLIGIDLLHYGVIFTMCTMIGQVSPPVASVLMTASAMAEIDIHRVVKPLMPLYTVMFAMLLLITFVPAISLWLPSIIFVK